MTVDVGRARHSARLRIFLAAVALALVILAGRLLQLQVVQARELASSAERQWRRAIELPAMRGAIYDRDGEPLALSVEAYDVYATPSQVVDKLKTAQSLASLLGKDAATWRGKLDRPGGFAWVERRVDLPTTQKLKAKGLQGIGFIPSSRRSYRIAATAAQVVGLSGVDGQGLAGLELYYDAVLEGTPGVVEAERDPRGRTLPGGLIAQKEPVNGSPISIALDSDIQYKAQVELYEAVRKHKAKGGVVLVMDPRTGAILACVSSPGADPSDLTTDTMRGMRNRVVSDAFEPGSTMKIVTVAAVLEERLVRPNTQFTLGPTIHVAGHEVHEAHSRGTETMSVADILAKSSNVGAVTLGLKLGEDRLFRYIELLGLTERTGVDFPGEQTGWVPAPEQWSGTSISTIPFGQGITATPLQMARVTATVANGGVAVKPHFIVSGGTSRTAVQPGRRVLSATTARALGLMLQRAVFQGTGQSAQVPGFTVAGKTGTAQKANEGRPGYREGAYLASFIGYAPATRPRLVCLVAIDEPTAEGYYGGVVAAPVFSNVMRFALSHLKVPPDDPKSAARAAREAADKASQTAASAATTSVADGAARGDEDKRSDDSEPDAGGVDDQ
jgi:cell division protein FtsI (penicillin-binding protein 3)